MTQLCNAKTRASTPCQQAAGWGTDHVGSGRCKLHGGASTGRPPIHGRYSIKKREALQGKIEAFYNDPQAGDLRAELALLRALLQDYLDRFEDGIPLSADDIGRMYGMVEGIGRLVERIAKILAMTALTQAELQLLQVTLIDALGEFIPDPHQQRAFISRIFGTIRGGTSPHQGTLSSDASSGAVI